jgi:hypothetical protein
MKQRIINYLFRHLLNAVVLEDVIREDKDILYIGNRRATDDELKQLIAECKALEGFTVWKLMNETIKKDALDRGWNKSVKMEDLNAGKTIFYTLDLQKSIIKAIRKREVVRN